MPTKPKVTTRKDASLTADERETVILMDDGPGSEGLAKISTHQKTIYTKLMNNPAATLVEDISIGTTVGGIFEIPANLLTFRTHKATRKVSDKEREAKKQSLAKARKVRMPPSSQERLPSLLAFL